MKTKKILGVSLFLTILFGLGFLLVYLFGGNIGQVSNTTFPDFSGRHLFNHDLGFSFSRAWDIIAFGFYMMMIIKVFIFIQELPPEDKDKYVFMTMVLIFSLFFAFGYPFLIGMIVGALFMIFVMLTGYEEQGFLLFFLVSIPITIYHSYTTFFGPGLTIGLIEGFVLASIIAGIYRLIKKIFFK